MRKNPLRVFFEMEIKPFWQRCFASHGQDPNEILGGLNLTSREAMLLGGTDQCKSRVSGIGPALGPLTPYQLIY